MPVIRRTYALPSETVTRFEASVAPGKRSSTLAQLLDSWLEERRRARLRRAVIEGCHEMSEIYKEIEREYHPLEEEVERAERRRSKSKTR